MDDTDHRGFAAPTGTTAAPAAPGTPTAVVDRFNHAWNDHDLSAALALLSEDCVFESTAPAPDGERAVGKSAIRAAWTADLRRRQRQDHRRGVVLRRTAVGAAVALRLEGRAHPRCRRDRRPKRAGHREALLCQRLTSRSVAWLWRIAPPTRSRCAHTRPLPRATARTCRAGRRRAAAGPPGRRPYPRFARAGDRQRPGRDALLLEQRGLRVARTDAARAFVEMLRVDGHDAQLLNVITDPVIGHFDGVLADAVLLHLSVPEFAAALRKLRGAVPVDWAVRIDTQGGRRQRIAHPTARPAPAFHLLAGAAAAARTRGRWVARRLARPRAGERAVVAGAVPAA